MERVLIINLYLNGLPMEDYQNIIRYPFAATITILLTKPTLTGYLLVLKSSLKNQALIDMAVSSKALNRNLFHFPASGGRLYALTNDFNLYL